MDTQEMEKDVQEIWKLFKETDRRFKETARRFKETARRSKKTDQQIKATSEQMKVTDQRLREMIENTNRRVEALIGKWGKFVEGLLVPAIERLFKERGITVDKVTQGFKAHKNGETMEIDILAINRDYAVLVEAKSTLSVDDVNEHLQKLDKFRSFFPEYAGRQVIGAVAGIVIEKGVDRFAYKCGLFVIGQTGEMVKILNDQKFVPRKW